MDLSKRLANLDRLSKKKNQPEQNLDTLPNADPEVLAQSLCQMQLVRSGTDDDPLWIREYSDKLAFNWSRLPPLLGFFTRADEADPRLEDILFLDTETTGLSGGTGTIAFMVGVGWIQNQTFHSRQYFLPDFSYEHAMLAELSVLARKFQVVMTFNGASFDLPLLRTRALMNRLKDPCASLVSWDLLVPGRRLWGRFFPNCKQQTLERGLLQMQRDSDDIDGALIPQTWFDFLKTADAHLMSKVLHHNQRDLLGMVGIFARVLDKAQCLHDNNPGTNHWKEAWALGRIAEIARFQECSAGWMQQAVKSRETESENRFLQDRFVADAIRLLKRQGHWPRVEAVIQKALKAGLDAPWLHREAAILYEHRIVHLGLALEHAHGCLEEGRVQRLQKKILKKNEANNDSAHSN